MKKIVITLLVVALLIPNIAFAENAGNVENDTVTRAEFARIVVRSRGFEGIISPRLTEFFDVPAEHWASGYIRVAAGLGVIQGNGDGNFRPDDAILVEEAIAMLMRALGWWQMAIANGGFLVGYFLCAERSGLTNGIDLIVGEYVTPDLLYELINNSLDIPLVEIVGRDLGHIMDGTGNTSLKTLRTEFWDNLPVYFDGENFIIIETE